jgi:predicted aldo/keto reductase-like oxidoreductase
MGGRYCDLGACGNKEGTMETIRFGRTGLRVGRTGFGAIPIQRLSFEEAGAILRRAYEGGVNLFDTARAYSDSEEKIGRALSPVRDKIILATKSGAPDKAGLFAHLETSLRNLKTDHVDILQLHNPTELPDPNDPNSTYSALLEARRKGMVRFLGITCHRLENAVAAAESGLYDTIQFPLSPISTPEDFSIIEVCRRKDLGLLGMKALCGGLLTNARSAFAFLRQYENVVPIWGIQFLAEIEEFLALEAKPPAMDAEILASIEQDRKELSGQFCRACGYCLPCPVEIPIPFAARMKFVLGRMPATNFLTEEWQQKMRRIRDCTHCRQCAERCPYELDTPELLKGMLEAYEAYLKQNVAGKG